MNTENILKYLKNYLQNDGLITQHQQEPNMLHITVFGGSRFWVSVGYNSVQQRLNKAGEDVFVINNEFDMIAVIKEIDGKDSEVMYHPV